MARALSPEDRALMDRLREEGRRRSEQLQREFSREAIDYLRIEDPWAYQCPTSAITARDIAQESDRLAFPAKVTDLLYKGGSPPPIVELCRKQVVVGTFAKPSLYGTHIEQCQPCKAFSSLYISFSAEHGRSEADFRALLRQPFGREVWCWTLAALRAGQSFATFSDYLHNHSLSQG